MKRTAMRMVVVLATVAAGSSLAACSSGSDDNATHADSSKLVSMLPAATKDIDQLNWNVTDEPDTLDPRNAVNYGSGSVMRNMCEGLLKMDDDFNVTPNLASSYNQVSPTQLVLNIRDGVKFWDGTPLTAQDVAYSLKRSAAPDSVVAFGFLFVKDIKVTGPMQVTVDFKRPDATFVDGLATLAGVVIEKAWGERTGKKIGTSAGGLMCTGPYKFVKWQSGSDITMTRNDNYWNSDLKPKAKNIKVTFISDDTALAQALNAGEIDGSYELPIATIAKLSKSKAGKVVFGPSTQSTGIYVSRPGGPLADLKLRDAFQRAIDRAALAKVVFDGAATPNYTELTPETWPNAERSIYQKDYDSWVKERAYDVTAAKKLVKESSYKGQTLVLAIQAGDESSSRVAQLIQQQAKAIGVKLKIQTMQPLVFDQASYDASKRKGVDLMYGSSFNSHQEPLEPLGFDLLPGQDYNYTNYNDPRVTSLLNEARATFDKKKQAELIVQAQKLYEPHEQTISLVSNHEVMFLNNKLTGAITSFAYWSMPQLAYIGGK